MMSQNKTPENSPRKHLRVSTLADSFKNRSALAQSDRLLDSDHKTRKDTHSIQSLELNVSNLDTYELEHLCSLDLSSNSSNLAARSAARGIQRLAARQLALNYYIGKDAIRSLKLSHKYTEMEIALTPISELERLLTTFHQTEAVQTASINEQHNQKFDAFKRYIIATRLANVLKSEKSKKKYAIIAAESKSDYESLRKHSNHRNFLDKLFDKIYHVIQNIFAWFNASRLIFSRLNTFLTGINRSLLSTPDLKIAARCLGLYFLAEIIIEGAQIINHVFLHAKKNHESDSIWQRIGSRFYHVMRHDNRWYRVINAVVSLTLNIIGLAVSIAAPPFAPIILIALTVLTGKSDILLEIGVLISGWRTQNSIFDRIKPHQEGDPAAQLIYQKMTESQAELLINRIYVITLMSLLVAGAILASIFPPLSVVYLIGAASALIFGSVFLGLGRRAFMKAVENKIEFITKPFNYVYGKLKHFVTSLLMPKPANIEDSKNQYTPLSTQPNDNRLVFENVTGNKSLECPDDRSYTTSLIKHELNEDLNDDNGKLIVRSSSHQTFSEFAPELLKIKQLCRDTLFHKSPSSGALHIYDPTLAALTQSKHEAPSSKRVENTILPVS